MFFWNELRKLFGRKQFNLLLAVLFFGNLFFLFLYEKNTDDYLYLVENREAYLSYRNSSHETDGIDYYETLLQEERAYPEEYRVFIQEMEERTEQLKKSSLLTREDPFRNKDLDKALKDYEKLKCLKIVSGDYTAVKKYGTYMTGILFEIAFVLLLLFYGFSEDKEQGRYQMLRSTKKGREALALSKVGTLSAVTVLYVVIQETSVILLLSSLYGAGELTAPIQSVPLFRNTHLSLSILSMYGLSLLYKSISLLTILMLSFFLSAWISRIQKAALCFAGILVTEFILWKTIGAASRLRALRYVSLFGFYLPSDSIGAYVNLNIFGVPVEKHSVTLILSGILLTGTAAFGTCLFSLKNQVRREGRLSGLLQRIRNVFPLGQRISSLKLLELYKPLIQQKKLLLILVILIYGVSLVKSAEKPVFFATGEEAAYEYYAEKLSGEYGERQELILKEEEEALQEERERMNTLLREAIELKKDPDDEEAIEQSCRLERQAQAISAGLTSYEAALVKVREQCAALKEKAEVSGKTVFFVNIARYKRFFRRSDDRLLTFLILGSTAVLLASGLNAMDEKFGMRTLIRTTMNGRNKLSSIRAGITAVFVLLLFLVFLIPETVRLYRIDLFSCLQASLGDFLMEGASEKLKIITVLGMTVLVKLGVFLIFGFASLTLSGKLKNEMMTAVLLIGAVILITAFGYLFSTDLITIILKAGGISWN